ncbi:MAG: hypothetical protein JOS17DRAFT_574476 [Linnemannia elongata]|nr:MAG: hypothetical protein JOS17DRAFT_574476 [Linnemannia elongata]
MFARPLIWILVSSIPQFSAFPDRVRRGEYLVRACDRTSPPSLSSPSPSLSPSSSSFLSPYSSSTSSSSNSTSSTSSCSSSCSSSSSPTKAMVLLCSRISSMILSLVVLSNLWFFLLLIGGVLL